MGLCRNISLFSGLLIWLIPLFTFGQTTHKLIDNGKKVILEITPIGHRVTNSDWPHTYKIFKSDSNYIVILKRNKEVLKKVYSKKQLKPFINYIKQVKRNNKNNYGLAQDVIVIIIDDKKSHYTTSYKSDIKLLDLMHKNNSIDPIKLGY